jgi:hypothetical protein
MGAPLRLLLLACVVAACSVVPGERPPLTVVNGTQLVINVSVNGQAIGQSMPGGPGLDIDEQALPPLPWIVEARTITGRLLLSMTVEPGNVTVTTHPNGAGEGRAVMNRLDLSCGMLVLVAGRVPSYGPASLPNAGAPGDCAP